LKPNKNQTAATFWRQVVYQLIYDGECLIVPTRDNYLVVAEDYERIEFAVREDKFRRVRVKNLDLSGEFKRSEVIFLQYGNEELSSLVDSLFGDYGELIARMFELQKMKGQLRATVNVDGTFLKTEDGQKNLQKFIDRTYNAIKKATDAFLDQVCHAVGLPPNLLKGDMDYIENMTRNAMKFCIDPIIKIISDELNMQMITKKRYLKGDRIDVKRIGYRDMFDI